MNNDQFNYLYEDGEVGYAQRLAELYPPEDAYRKTEDVLLDEWLRNFYLGKVEEHDETHNIIDFGDDDHSDVHCVDCESKTDYCLRHQHSFKGKSCDQCSH